MGGYNSGGHNRTHDYTGRYKRLDSFYYGKRVPLMEKAKRDYFESSIKWTDGGTIGIVLFPNKLAVGYSTGSGAEREEIRDTFYFTGIPNNYGGPDRIYFTCPCCGRRARFLYLHRRHFKCRTCAGLNYLSQQLTKNEDMAAYKIRKLLRDKFKITEDLSPMDASRYRPEQPKGMHMKTYIRLSLELLKLQEEYTQGFIRSCVRIMGPLSGIGL